MAGPASSGPDGGRGASVDRGGANPEGGILRARLLPRRACRAASEAGVAPDEVLARGFGFAVALGFAFAAVATFARVASRLGLRRCGRVRGRLERTSRSESSGAIARILAHRRALRLKPGAGTPKGRVKDVPSRKKSTRAAFQQG